MLARSMMVVMAVLGVMLTGCYESPQVVLHKPGVYKGAKDPLVEKQASPEQQKQLLMRFNQVQTDR